MSQGIFSVHAEISRPWRIILGASTFAAIILMYGICSHLYLQDNPNGRLLPSFAQMWDQMWELATVPSKRTGELVLLSDIQITLTRLLAGAVPAIVLAFICGLLQSFYPVYRAIFYPFTKWASNFVIVAVTAPVMLIVGIDETFKYVMVFLGLFFILTRDVTRAADAIPSTMMTKSLSLGASEFGVVFRLMAQQLVPHLLSAVRIAMISGWTMLIVAESTAAQGGLGYRIATVRRFMDMETIIPYVLVIALLAFIIDFALQMVIKYCYPWFNPTKK